MESIKALKLVEFTNYFFEKIDNFNKRNQLQELRPIIKLQEDLHIEFTDFQQNLIEIENFVINLINVNSSLNSKYSDLRNLHEKLSIQYDSTKEKLGFLNKNIENLTLENQELRKLLENSNLYKKQEGYSLLLRRIDELESEIKHNLKNEIERGQEINDTKKSSTISINGTGKVCWQ